MTPSQYKARYEKLVVPLDNGNTTTIRINQYRLRSKNYNEVAAKAFFNALQKHGPDMELRVDIGAETFRILHRTAGGGVQVNEETRTGPVQVQGVAAGQHAVHEMARYAFAGKGAPEHCQLVLQLVDHWKLAPDGLQKYADDALGLDCNGFVGNFLWHIKTNHPWSNLGVSNLDHGPDAWISGYFDGKKLLSKWEDLNPARSYIMGMVDSAGNIIHGGGTAADSGHIAITEPNRFRRPHGPIRSAVWAVESTGGHFPGLWESWYSCLGVDGRKVFSIYREEMIAGSQKVHFKIAEA
jgi:hypothetical protein